jgi:hypothetical protein
MDRLQSLHPQSNVHDFLPEADVSWPSLELEQTHIMATINNLPKLSSTAFSGWTYELVKKVCGSSVALSELTTTLFNRMLAGQAGDARLWGASRLVALGKKGGGVRPIAIGDTWLRVLGRAVASHYAQAAADSLSPHQFGVGIPGGVELITHTTELAHCHPEMGVLAIDFSNAFNSIRRGPVYTGICNHFPFLRRFFLWAYGVATPLCNTLGELVCHSETGVKQGDPLGPLYFSVGIANLLSQTVLHHPTIKVMAYLDDVTLVGPPAECLRAYDTVRKLGEDIGLLVNTRKSFLLAHPEAAETIPDHYRHFLYPQIAQRGNEILGVPIGDDAFIATSVTEKFETRSTILETIGRLPATMAVPLIQACVNERPVFWKRTVFPALTQDASRLFDEAVDRCLASVAGIDGLPAMSKLVRHLPGSFGGINIRRMSECDALYASSILFAIYRMQSIAPEYLARLQSFLDAPSLPRYNEIFDVIRELDTSHQRFITFEAPMVDPLVDIIIAEPVPDPTPSPVPSPLDVVTPLQSDESDEEDMDVAAAPLILQPQPAVAPVPLHYPRFKHISDDDKPERPSRYFARIDARVRDRVLEGHTSSYAKRWFISGGAIGTAKWIWMGCTNNVQNLLTEEEYTDALRLRLLIPFYFRDGDHIRRCLCGVVASEDNYGYHCLSCSRMAATIARHNAVRDAVQQFLEAIHKQVTVEPLVNPDRELRADLRYNDLGVPRYIDVTVINPTAAAYDPPAHEAPTHGQPSTIQEGVKVDRYVRQGGLATDRFIPFVVEATGSIGPRGLEWLENICKVNGVPDDDLGKARKRFLLHLSAVVIRGNSKHLAEYRRTSTVGLRPVGARHLGIVAPPPVVPQADEGLEAALQAIADLPEHMEEPVPLQEEAPVEVAEAAEGHVDEVTQLTPDNEF